MNDIRSQVALKLIPKVGRNAKDLASLRQECQLQKELRHPHIVIMMDAFETHNEIVAVTEYIPTGDLTKILQSKVKSATWKKLSSA
jgi:serine/threonine protein kinase